MSLSRSHLNIKGVDSQSIGCKLKSQSFKDNVLKYDIVVLTEAWGCNHDFSIAGYETLLIKLNEKKHIKSGRSSGDVIIIHKNFLENKIDLVQTDQHYLWIKLKTKTKNVLNESRLVYICAAYVPPVNSKYYSDEIFSNIEKDITFYSRNGDCIILVGDFNARTSNKPDFIDTSVNDKSFEIIDAPQDVQSVSINTGRNNYDSHSNKHGDRILDICKACNVRIMNGRKSGDTFGKPTFYSHDGSSSCIDYIIISDEFFQSISSFVVQPQIPISDHCIITSRLKVSGTNINLQNQADDNYKWTKLASNFHWNNRSSVELKSALKSDRISLMISNFLNTEFEKSENGIEEANKAFTEILVSSAKMSLSYKRFSNNKRTINKKWFNKECRSISKKFCIASNLRNKNPGNESLKTKCCRLLKEYQSTYKANKKRFFQNQVNTLYSTDNSNLWKNWKNCGDELGTKTPAVKNGTV